MNKVATKSNWKTTEFTSGKTVKLPLNFKFSPEQFAHVKKGIIPQQMEDKWFVYYEDGSIYFHRSWTGFLVYKVSVFPDSNSGATANEFEVNNDPEQYCPSLTSNVNPLPEEQDTLVPVSGSISVPSSDQSSIPEVGFLMELISWICEPK